MNRIYVAGPLFSLAERAFNAAFARKIASYAPECEIILPQERAKKFLHLENGLRLVFEDCLASVAESKVVIGILDGADADSGTCAELGYAYARNIPIVGVRTDFRASEDRGLNLMLSHLCSVLIYNTEADIDELSQEVAQQILKMIS